MKAHYEGGLAYTRSQTETMKLHGWMKKVDFDDPLYYYGSDAAAIRYLQGQGYSQLIHPELPYTVAEVAWAVLNEMAMTVEDVLARRSRALFLDSKAALACMQYAADVIKAHLNHSEAEMDRQKQEFERLVEQYSL